jgi:hypothetical protein
MNIINKNIKLVIRDFVIENKFDIFKFIFYTGFFLFLFFSYNKVTSPISQEYLNSAQDATTHSEPKLEVIDDSFDLGQKTSIKPSITLQFNPYYIKVDDLLVKALKFNTESKYFKDKVTPLDITIDGTRIDPR